jgi:hypothetical protein
MQAGASTRRARSGHPHAHANKLLIAFVEGKACSASYALAAAADTIVLGQSGIVGSIGIISTRADISEMNAQRGVRVTLITSGARKADGNPDQPITDAELKATQQLVDSMASVFFDLVAELRGIDATSRSLRCRQVCSTGRPQSRSVSRIECSRLTKCLRRSRAEDRPLWRVSYEKAKAALEEAAKGDDANAAAAKRALAAMEEKKPEKAADDGDKPEAAATEEDAGS